MRKDNQLDSEKIHFISDELNKDYPEQWLLRLEIYELMARGWLDDETLKSKIRLELEKIKTEQPKTTAVIEDGLSLADRIF